MGGGGGKSDGADGVRTVGDVKLMARAVEGIELKDLRSLADEGKKKVGSGVVAIVGVTGDGKAGIVVGVTDDLVARFNAVDLVRKGAEALGGKGGGGRPDMAQAGGPDGRRRMPRWPRSRRRSALIAATRYISTIMPSSAVSNGSSARRASMSLLIWVRIRRFGRIWPRCCSSELSAMWVVIGLSRV